MKNYSVEYLSARGRTSSVRISGRKVVMRLSPFARGRKRDEIIEKFLKWANKRMKSMGNDFVEPEYRDGGKIVTHNKIYEIRVVDGNSKLKNNYLLEICSGTDLQKKAEELIIKDQISYLNEVIRELNELHFKERIARISFKRMNSRFGSCSSRRNINIAYRLLFAPREVFRYVCVHELAHLKQMNHSKKFWALVGEACPDFQAQRKWLRENGFGLG